MLTLETSIFTSGRFPSTDTQATKHQFLAMIAEEILCELSDRPICAWHDPIATMNMPAHQDNFHVFLQRANDTLCQLQEEGNEILPTVRAGRCMDGCFCRRLAAVTARAFRTLLQPTAARVLILCADVLVAAARKHLPRTLFRT